MSGVPRRKYLLIADPFHPKALPAEAGVNTFLATALAARGWEVAVWTSAGSTLPPDLRGLRLVRTVDYWGPTEILRIAFWIAFNRPARIGLLYFSDMYSARGFVTLVPLLARMLGIPCATLFTNNQRPKGSGVLLKLLTWRGQAQQRCAAPELPAIFFHLVVLQPMGPPAPPGIFPLGTLGAHGPAQPAFAPSQPGAF